MRQIARFVFACGDVFGNYGTYSLAPYLIGQSDQLPPGPLDSIRASYRSSYGKVSVPGRSVVPVSTLCMLRTPSYSSPSLHSAHNCLLPSEPSDRTPHPQRRRMSPLPATLTLIPTIVTAAAATAEVFRVRPIPIILAIGLVLAPGTRATDTHDPSVRD